MKFMFLFLLIVTACGKNNGGGGSAQKLETIQVAQETNAQYRVVFGGLNGKASFGTASLEFEESSKLIINFSMINFPGQVIHSQTLHIGEKCPSIDDDLNKDGFVDYEEGLKVFGELTFAFDDQHGSSYTYSDEFETSDMPSNLVLQGKALVVYGTQGPLPATVTSKEGEDAAASLPVACGIIQKVLTN